MTDEELFGYDQDLLCLTTIGHIPHIIDASSIVASSRSIPHPSRYQRDLALHPIQLACSLGKIALYKRSEPSNIDVLPDEVSVLGLIPEVLMITGNEFERVSLLLLHPCEASLARCCQIVAIREIEAIFQVFLDIFDHLLCFGLLAQLNQQKNNVTLVDTS